MAEIKKIYIAVYGFDLFYLISSWEECVKAFKEQFNDDDISNKAIGTGWATSLEGDGGETAYFIWINNEAGFDVIAHEVFHAVKYILIDFAGMVLSDHSDEAFAYLLAYLCKQIIDKEGEVCRGEQKPHE